MTRAISEAMKFNTWRYQVSMADYPSTNGGAIATARVLGCDDEHAMRRGIAKALGCSDVAIEEAHGSRFWIRVGERSLVVEARRAEFAAFRELVDVS